MSAEPYPSCRNLVLVLGDQLSFESGAFDGFDPACDRVWMAEVEEEARHVPSHKARIALFLSAMRHFAQDVRRRNWQIEYLNLESHAFGSLAEALSASIRTWRPRCLVVVQPGDWRVEQSLRQVAQRLEVRLEVRSDRSFVGTLDEFRAWARGRRRLVQEYWYRHLRQKTGVLMEGNQPRGGRWNYDSANREPFGARGPGLVPSPAGFPPDGVTQEVLRLVESRFRDHPGRLDSFDWPIDGSQARHALQDFLQNRLSEFGRHQDALWAGEPYLYHSRLSAALNLKLLHPLEVVRGAETAHLQGKASLESTEGFVRQILGWREYVRGLYHLWMPEWLEWNALHADLPLPKLYWTSHTEMSCLREVVGQTLRLGYAHHIQRLMVTGLFAMLLGVQPLEVHRWYLAIYVDAVEWVELPNTLGMSQFADGGRMATKPYAASGRYIQRMSNYCQSCRFHPERATGEDACPFTTLYWDFLERHRDRLATNPRMIPMLRNLDRLAAGERLEIRRRADRLRENVP